MKKALNGRGRSELLVLKQMRETLNDIHWGEKKCRVGGKTLGRRGFSMAETFQRCGREGGGQTKRAYFKKKEKAQGG